MKARAAVLHTVGAPMPFAQSRPLRIEEIDAAGPGPGEVLVRVRAAGLCHSDLSVINGDRPRPLPLALGHEAAGEVMECGPLVVDLERGDHVVMVFVPSCGHCVPCMEGRPALCEPGAASNTAGTLPGGGRRISMAGAPVNHHMGVSAFAEYAVVSRRSLVKIDPTLAGSCVPVRDIPRYIALYKAGRLPVDRLMSDRLRLDDINAGFDRLASGQVVRQVVIL